MEQQKFEDLKKYIGNKIKISKDNLEEKSAGLSTLYFHCIDTYSAEFRLYKDMKIEAERIYGERYKFYAFNYDRQLKTKNEIDAHIWSDPEYYEYMKKLNFQES